MGNIFGQHYKGANGMITMLSLIAEKQRKYNVKATAFQNVEVRAMVTLSQN